MTSSTYDQWAEIYDSVYSYLKEDIAFYVEEATNVQGPFLELGCGTGFFLLNLIIITVMTTVLFGLGFSMDPYAASSGGPVTWLIFAVMGLYSLIVLIPSIAVQVRRFHDQDKSGWFVLLNFIPYVGGLIVLVFMFLEGTKGENRYGPDPKAGAADVGDIFS